MAYISSTLHFRRRSLVPHQHHHHLALVVVMVDHRSLHHPHEVHLHLEHVSVERSEIPLALSQSRESDSLRLRHEASHRTRRLATI